MFRVFAAARAVRRAAGGALVAFSGRRSDVSVFPLVPPPPPVALLSPRWGGRWGGGSPVVPGPPGELRQRRWEEIGCNLATC